MWSPFSFVSVYSKLADILKIFVQIDRWMESNCKSICPQTRGVKKSPNEKIIVILPVLVDLSLSGNCVAVNPRIWCPAVLSRTLDFLPVVSSSWIIKKPSQFKNWISETSLNIISILLLKCLPLRFKHFCLHWRKPVVKTHKGSPTV